MNCEETRSHLDSFLDGRLRGEQSRQLRLHLRDCARCAASLTLADRIEILPALDAEIEPSKDLALRFQARLSEHRAALSAPKGFSTTALIRTWLATPMRQIMTVGALAAFLISGVYLGLYHVPAPGPMPGSGEVVIAENLPLLQDMGVIKNLDLLEDLDTIQDLTSDQLPQTGIR
jgi:anti-sigma factor RsiW